MFEISIAIRYLLPKKKQLSVSLISMMSIGVIALVVWLSLVFLSVTEGIEKKWLHKLTSLQAPLRLTPTSHYYTSYYYQIDAFSGASNFQSKTIHEKWLATHSDPYNPLEDQELPLFFPSPDPVQDPVKTAFALLQDLRSKQPISFSDFEVGGALLRLQLLRDSPQGKVQTFLTQASYVSSMPEGIAATESLLLPSSSSLGPQAGSGIWLAKNFQDMGVLIGDAGYLSYSAATTGALQEQRLPVFVAGFYDPGVMSIGAKCILAPRSIAHAIHTASSSLHLDPSQSNGILVWFPDLENTDRYQALIQQSLQDAHVDPYWQVTTFKEYDFAKDLLQQFQSDQYLFMMVGIIILIVACCNIISLLVLLVNDKKHEIGILQAMGASKWSIASIFGLAGVIMGIISCGLGVLAAIFTLHHIDLIVQGLSWMQGHEAFNPTFFGGELPSELSYQAVKFMAIATPLMALLAGLVPAIKACRFKPATLLRTE